MKYEGKKKNQTILQKQHIRLIEWMKGKAEYEGVFFPSKILIKRFFKFSLPKK